MSASKKNDRVERYGPDRDRPNPRQYWDTSAPADWPRNPFSESHPGPSLGEGENYAPNSHLTPVSPKDWGAKPPLPLSKPTESEVKVNKPLFKIDPLRGV